MSTSRAPQAPRLIGASAGSGKTYRLTEVVTAAVDPASAESIELEGLVAVTYTTKGAAELASRIRQSLARNGAHEATNRLPLAYIGTVHAACLRLVKEFALDAGLSPLVDVMPSGEDRLLRQALEWGLEPDLRRRLDDLADAVELRLEGKTSRVDWLTPVHDIMTLARSNRITASALPAMAERSVTRLLQLLGPPEHDGPALDAALLEEIQRADAKLSRVDDGQKNTAQAKRLVSEMLKKASDGNLKWSDWLRLESVGPGKAGAAAVAQLREVAGRVDHHPRLHAELRELTQCMYGAAQQGLDAYDEWKRRRRIIDFVDMLDRALTLVEHPDVQRELSQRVELLVVDEFQDTSPIQLALFTRIHQLAGRSTWVGDRKQCIFEYAGADPELMEAVSDWAKASGGTVEQLPHNWRSRPELVECCNALFIAAFGRHGYTREQVATAPKRAALPDLAALPALGFWAMEAANQDEEAAALAEGVRRMLANPASTPIFDRSTAQVRGVRPGDIAILVATNAEAERIAEALAPRGVRAAIARAGLLATPEGTLVTAALRVLLDPGNTLAAAEIEALTGFNGLDPDAWLAERITQVAARRVARESGQRADAPPPAPPTGYLARLEPLRAEVQVLSPTEAVDRVLASFDLISLCKRWPDPGQRTANLDALRALAATYEERCAKIREAATVAGLLRYFDDASTRILVHDEELASDNQHTNTGPDAATIVTYHRAKGLEWPVVILGSLDRKRKRNAFSVSPESERTAFDPTDPLGGRWIRYWPWPYGPKKSAGLKDVAAASPEGREIDAREERERVRLLYVGFTRARDHLVLAVRVTSKGYASEWLNELCDETGPPLVQLPKVSPDNELGEIRVRSADPPLRVPTRCWVLNANSTASLRSEPARTWFAGPEQAAAASRPPYWIAPSRAAVDWPELDAPVAAEVVSTGPRLPLSGARRDWDIVGNAVHAFLAADVPELTDAQRRVRAERLLGASDLLGVLTPDALIQAGDNLRAWIQTRWPAATWHREMPVTAVIATPAGARRVQGTIDLLLETAEGVVLIDHKTYPGARDTWSSKALEFAPQIAAYAEALRLAGKHVVEQWVSFAIAGGAVRLVDGTEVRDGQWDSGKVGQIEDAY